MVNLKKQLLICVLLVLAFSSVAYGHMPDQSYIYLQIHEDSITGQFEVTTKDLNKVFGTDLKAGLTSEDLAPHLAKIQAYLFERASFTSKEGVDFKISFTEPDFLRADFYGDFVQMKFRLEGVTKIPEKIDVRYEAFFREIPGHTCLLVIEQNKLSGIANNESMHSLEFSANNTKQELLTAGGIQMWALWVMIQSGVWHIWIGFDHILFLFALLLPSVLVYRSKDTDVEPGIKSWTPVEKFKPALINVIKIITCFTIAHSITLSLAAFGVVELPSRLIESIIAISIAMAAIHNIYPLISGKDWMIAFGFGLFHGFGFASILAEKGMGGDYLLVSVFGFNLGVELGQLAIIVLVFPILFLLRKTFLYPRIRVFGSLFLIFMALYWFTERAFDLDFPVGRYVLRALGLL